MSDIQEKQETIEMDTEPEIPLLKPKRKMKKFPRTEKQQEAFKITMQKRAENVEKRKQQKKIEAAKLLLSTEPDSLPTKPEQEKEPEKEPKEKIKKPKKKLILSTTDTETDSDSSDSGGEEEKIYIARKSIKQPKKVYIIKREKNIIEEDDEDEYEKPVVNKFKSQQNKKSVVKISNNIQPSKNYFCD